MPTLQDLPPLNARYAPVMGGRTGLGTFLRLAKLVCNLTLRYQARIRAALDPALHPYFDAWLEFIPVLLALIDAVDFVAPGAPGG